MQARWLDEKPEDHEASAPETTQQSNDYNIIIKTPCHVEEDHNLLTVRSYLFYPTPLTASDKVKSTTTSNNLVGCSFIIKRVIEWLTIGLCMAEIRLCSAGYWPIVLKLTALVHFLEEQAYYYLVWQDYRFHLLPPTLPSSGLRNGVIRKGCNGLKWPANATNCDFQDSIGNTVEPVKLFEYFWTDTFFEYIKEQSVLYATQNNANTSFDVSVAELKVFFAILMISGYSPRPRKDFYWSMDSDLQNEAIANAMPRNRFREILKNLHFANNAELPPNDKFAKVRPLIEHLNNVFIKHIPLTEAIVPIAVDESMVPYYSHHSCKQRIQGKPIRYGFKFWSANTSNGYLINTEPYQGKGTLLGDSELGLGASVVSTFATRLKQILPSHKFNFFIDNFFTGLPLIRKMSDMEYGCTGTIRQNRLERCPLDKKSMNKLPRYFSIHTVYKISPKTTENVKKSLAANGLS
ncbi:hypothetical protein NQ317_018685 [Molorchus minor]|uniref:PiggyBac transposable element-derived protein domain-containing protein n=1 Tax=Molorchus minor TaxID=1323400 RepID=A0ABQ9J2Z8_9CUCU|nr:hypothetical protein NQ317_018685 [Molorchus minor]